MIKKENCMVLASCQHKNEGKSNYKNLVVVDFTTELITPFVFDGIKDLVNLSFCKLNNLNYFISGGHKKDDPKEISLKNFIVNIGTKEVKVIPDALVKKYKFDLVAVDGSIYRLPGEIDNTKYDKSFEKFSFKDNKWERLPDAPQEYRWTLSSFVYKKTIVLCSKNQFFHFDLTENQWKLGKGITYDIDNLFLTKSGKILMVNGYYSSIYNYDFQTNTICLERYIEELGYTPDVFYVEELNSLFFCDTYKHQKFFIYDCEKQKMIEHSGEESKKFFGDYYFFEFHSNPTLAKKDSNFIDLSENLMEDYAFIYGNWQQPFQMRISLKEGAESAEIQSISMDLHLKSSIGVQVISESELLFAGGYDDERSLFATSDTYSYNIDLKTAKQLDDLQAEVEDTYLKKVSKGGKDDGFLIYLLANNDGNQCFDTKTLKWKTIAANAFDFTPIALDEPDRFIVFNTIEDHKSKTGYILFQGYDPIKDIWTDLIKKDVTFKTYKQFCYKIAENQYLMVIDKGDEVQILSKLTLKWSEGKISDFTLEDLDKFSDKPTQEEVEKFFRIGDFLFFVFTDEDFGYKTKFLDLKSLKFADSPRCTKVANCIKNAFDSLNFQKGLWHLKYYALIGPK